eukprot:CAMPEP_0172923020 /NCGR_PEP_ID=MMETSP1075-20121228/208964_1 /TAXON_ID=2916 /ORGANISM="Ceratium fusus, Strain PA161109" /LENGTH=31 /DNA_ID= /DNA_START= /DNA_END= /DNA_ORIENTATION=
MSERRRSPVDRDSRASAAQMKIPSFWETPHC